VSDWIDRALRAGWTPEVKSALRIVAIVLGASRVVMLVLKEFGVSIARLLGAAGVVGIAAGFGAQRLIRDHFDGFFLFAENRSPSTMRPGSLKTSTSQEWRNPAIRPSCCAAGSRSDRWSSVLASAGS
jgi:hypothetical protein